MYHFKVLRMMQKALPFFPLILSLSLSLSLSNPLTGALPPARHGNRNFAAIVYVESNGEVLGFLGNAGDMACQVATKHFHKSKTLVNKYVRNVCILSF